MTEDVAAQPKQVIVDLGYRGVDVDADNPGVEIIHRGKFKSLSKQQRRWLKRRQAVEPAIGHCKHDNAMERCWLKGQTGDAVHAVLCAAGYNIRWLLRAMVRLGLKGCAPFVCARVAWIGAGTGVGHEKIRLLNGVRHARVNFAGPTKDCPAKARYGE